ncbi:hypothetical protein PROFUN_04339 [Planoprotostelium fungivorum]|uniref:CRAL-TRIO domain-containing protein n=1 Tax=Planoprotostelium fungivorum TaxID=1890364 RepID=A0A2P6NV72_9EUKA|nr:hypothetical protein PROFUN_04339 [Planoprotostelium fungivorum]
MSSSYTPIEQQAIANLKSQLDDIVKSAKEDPELGASIKDSLWGISLSSTSEDTRLPVLLIKFIRARRQARAMLLNTLKWRASFKADTILTEEFPPEVFNGVGYIQGEDKEGRPVCYNMYGGLDPETVFGDLNRFLRWRVQLMEKGIQLLDFDKKTDMVQVHDYKGVSFFSSNSTTKNASSATIKIMQDNYPEFLATKFFINIPTWGAFLFKVFRPILSEATRKKFVVCSEGSVTQMMTERIDPSQLPDRYGGKVVSIVSSNSEIEAKTADSLD